MKNVKTISKALMVMLLVTGCATKTAQVSDYSGYIGDYEGLAQTTDELGKDVLRWKNPDLVPGVYDTLMIDPIVFYPKPEPTAQISRDLLMDIGDYANKALKREVGKVVKLSDQPGPRVLRMRIAITGISTAAEELSAYEYIPIAAIAAGVNSASGGRDREVFLVAEAEFVDSMTGERMFIEVIKDHTPPVLENDTEQVTLEMVQEVLDRGAQQTRLFIEQAIARAS